MARLGRKPIKPGRATMAVALGTIGLFVISMAAGLSSWPFGAMGAAMLIVAIALLTTASMRGADKAFVAGTVKVVEAPAPPVGVEYGRAEMHLLIAAAGHQGKTVVVRDPRVPVDRWPREGDTLPAMVAVDDPRRVKIQWDRIGYHEPTREHTREHAADDYLDNGAYRPDGYEDAYQPDNDDADIYRADAYPADVYPADAYQTDAYPADIYEPGTRDTTGSDAVTAESNEFDGPTPDPSYSDDDPDEPAPLPRRTPGEPPPGFQPGPQAAPESAPDTSESTVVVLDESTPGVPQPRSAPEDLPDPPPARPASAGAIQGVGITVLVTDLDRSLVFYRDTLGFYEVDGGDGNVVLASGVTRIILRRADEAEPVNRRLVHLNLEVGDVQAVYQELKVRGVRFTYPPRVVNSGERLDLVAASFKDPDGHGIAITQWLAR